MGLSSQPWDGRDKSLAGQPGLSEELQTNERSTSRTEGKQKGAELCLRDDIQIVLWPLLTYLHIYEYTHTC